DAEHIGAEARSSLAVDLDAPLDARQGTVVLDIDEAAKALHFPANAFDPLLAQCRVQRADLQLHRLAVGGALFLFAKLQNDTGNVRSALTHLGKNVPGGPALVPVDELELQGADHIGAELALLAFRLGQGACVERLDLA